MSKIFLTLILLININLFSQEIIEVKVDQIPIHVSEHNGSIYCLGWFYKSGEFRQYLSLVKVDANGYIEKNLYPEVYTGNFDWIIYDNIRETIADGKITYDIQDYDYDLHIPVTYSVTFDMEDIDSYEEKYRPYSVFEYESNYLNGYFFPIKGTQNDSLYLMKYDGENYLDSTLLDMNGGNYADLDSEFKNTYETKVIIGSSVIYAISLYDLSEGKREVQANRVRVYDSDLNKLKDSILQFDSDSISHLMYNTSWSGPNDQVVIDYSKFKKKSRYALNGEYAIVSMNSDLEFNTLSFDRQTRSISVAKNGNVLHTKFKHEKLSDSDSTLNVTIDELDDNLNLLNTFSTNLDSIQMPCVGADEEGRPMLVAYMLDSITLADFENRSESRSQLKIHRFAPTGIEKDFQVSNKLMHISNNSIQLSSSLDNDNLSLKVFAYDGRELASYAVNDQLTYIPVNQFNDQLLLFVLSSQSGEVLQTLKLAVR